MRRTIEQFKVKGLYLYFALNFRISGENCLIFNWHGSRSAPGISFSRVPTKDDEYRINWWNKIVAVITRDRWSEGSLERQIKNRTFWVSLSSKKKKKKKKKKKICHKVNYSDKTSFFFKLAIGQKCWSFTWCLSSIWRTEE